MASAGTGRRGALASHVTGHRGDHRRARLGGDAPTAGTSTSRRARRARTRSDARDRRPARRVRDSSAHHADLARAVRQLRALRHALGQALGARNVPHQPVQHVVGAVADRGIDVVHEEREARGAVGHAAPGERRRHFLARAARTSRESDRRRSKPLDVSVMTCMARRARHRRRRPPRRWPARGLRRTARRATRRAGTPPARTR